LFDRTFASFLPFSHTQQLSKFHSIYIIFLSLCQAHTTDFQPSESIHYLPHIYDSNLRWTHISFPSRWTLAPPSLLRTRMCVTVTKCYRTCTATPRHTFQQDLMCAAGEALNPATWCPPDPNYAPAHYPRANLATKMATIIDCPYCTNMRVY
jgi:hypothetical protein